MRNSSLYAACNACDNKFVGINVCGTCLINENHKHFMPSKYTRYIYGSLTAIRADSKTSVQAGAVLMPLAMFLLSLKSIRVLSIMNFILKLAYLYKVTEKKRLIYMHLLLLFIVLCGLPGPQERRKLILPGSVVQCI